MGALVAPQVLYRRPCVILDALVAFGCSSLLAVEMMDVLKVAVVVAYSVDNSRGRSPWQSFW